MKKVAVIMGSDSDFPVVSGAVKTLNEYGVQCEVHIMSAHRTPEQAAEFSANSAVRGSYRAKNTYRSFWLQFAESDIH